MHLRCRPLPLVLGPWSLVLLASTSSALAAPISPAPAVSPDIVQLDPVVTTIARASAPLVVTADPKAPAQPAPAHDGADVLKNIAGFSVIRKGGTDGDPVLRGLAGSRLGIQIDGECIYGGCGNRMDPPTAYVFPAAYDRITVVKGPQSVLHGPGNSAGVVLFERDTRRPAARENSLFASATAGSFGRFDAAFDARVAAPVAQARVSATTTRADDYTDGSGRSVHSAYDRWSANASAAWTPDAQTVLEFSTARSDGEAAYADRAMDGVKFARENYGLRFTRTALTPLIASAEAHFFHNYVDHVMDNFSRRTFAPSMMMPGRAVSNPDRLTTGGLAQLVLTPAAPARVTVGLDTQRNTHSVRSTSNELTAPFAANARLRDAAFLQTGAFAESAFTLSRDQRLYAGARLDHWRATDERAAVALSMMSTAPNPGARHTRTSDLASGFARYERDVASSAATVFAGLGRTATFPGLLGNREKRERRLRHRVRRPARDHHPTRRRHPLPPRSVRLSVSAFVSQIDDYLLVQTNFAKTSTAPAMPGMPGMMPGMGGMTTTTRTTTITRNVDASTWGGEADLGWRLAEHWNVDASLAYVRGENDTDSLPLAQLPPLESRIGISYTRPVWSAGALLRLVSAQDRVAVNQGNIVGQDLGRSAGFGALALHASWRLTARVRASAGVDNVLDRTYAEHISRAGSTIPGFIQTTRVNEPGRFFWLKLDASL
jgi:iron complex outermembrane receptor protein